MNLLTKYEYLNAQTVGISWPTDTLFLSWERWKSDFCDQTMCRSLDCELFSSEVVSSQLTLVFGREKNYKKFQKFLQVFFAIYLPTKYRYLNAQTVGGSCHTDTLFLSWERWKSAFCDQTMCRSLDCELFSSEVVSSQLTLVFGREKNYKKFQKFLQVFFAIYLLTKYEYLNAQTVGISWPTDTLFLSWEEWKSAFCDQTMCRSLDCTLLRFGHNLPMLYGVVPEHSTNLTTLCLILHFWIAALRILARHDVTMHIVMVYENPAYIPSK